MARIETTPAVKVALYALRVYLIILLLLIVVKFLRLFPAHPSPPKKTAVVTILSPDPHRASPSTRVWWARSLTGRQVAALTPERVLGGADGWNPRRR